MKTLAENPKSWFDYELLEHFQAGLVLTGAEVKSAKSGNVSLKGTYVKVSPTEATLINCHIGPYDKALNEKYDPTRSRKLLLTKKQLLELFDRPKGQTVVPVKMLVTKNLVKVDIAIGRGKRKHDKRDALKKRDLDRQVRKALN